MFSAIVEGLAGIQEAIDLFSKLTGIGDSADFSGPVGIEQWDMMISDNNSEEPEEEQQIMQRVDNIIAQKCGDV